MNDSGNTSHPVALLIDLPPCSNQELRDFIAWLQREAAKNGVLVAHRQTMRYDPEMGRVVLYQP